MLQILLNKIIKIIQVVICIFRKPIIASGEFKDIKITMNHFGSSMLPKLIGYYEKEITADFCRLIRDVSVFVDVGCAGGYYCELAVQLRPGLQVVGYDLNKKAIQHCKNHIPGKFYAEEFTPIEYDKYSSTKCLFIIDIEGDEFKLFERLESLSPNHTFIVEVHDFMAPTRDLKRFIDEKFNCHTIVHEYIGPLNRNPERSFFYNMICLNELRDPNTSFLVIEPK